MCPTSDYSFPPPMADIANHIILVYRAHDEPQHGIPDPYPSTVAGNSTKPSCQFSTR